VSRSTPALAALFAAASIALGAAPAAAALFGDDVARRGVADQQKRVDGLSARFDDLSARFAKLEEVVKAQASSGNQPMLELANQLQSMREEMRSMRGQLEVLSNGIEAGSKRQRDMYVDLDTRLRRFEQSPPGAASPSGAAPAPGAAAPAPAPAASASAPPPIAAAAAAAAAAPPAVDETRAYEAAQNQRRIGNYQAAVVAFQNFVTHYPRSPLAHRAQYWVGDSYYNLRDYKNAIANQQKLISTYPESASVPPALLNIASSYIELGDNAAARRTMDSLIARYPSSDAAEKARRRSASLR
jgi:tol-pal system protein YbgF